MEVDRCLGKVFDLELGGGPPIEVRLSSVNPQTDEAMLHVYEQAGYRRLPTRWTWVQQEITAGRMNESERRP